MEARDATWRDYDEKVSESIAMIPMGALDAHGPHLPLATDTIISEHLASRLAEHVDLLLLPAVNYGRRTNASSGGGQFPGAVSLRGTTLIHVVRDILDALYAHGARRFLILDSHMANIEMVREAADLFVSSRNGARVMVSSWWDLVSEESRDAIAEETGTRRHEDHHAAMVETSIMMHVSPSSVRRDLICDDRCDRRVRYLVTPAPPSTGTEKGVVYRARSANEAIGKRVVDEVLANLVSAVQLELPRAS